MACFSLWESSIVGVMPPCSKKYGSSGKLSDIARNLTILS